MVRENLTIGQQVLVVPEWTNKELPPPTVHKVYVRELHNPKLAGVSHTKNSRSCFGILYSVLQPV